MAQLRNGGVNREHFVSILVKKFDVSDTMARDILETLLDQMRSALILGYEIRFSAFGSFRLKDRESRECRVFGQITTVAPKRTIFFSPAESLRDSVQRGYEDALREQQPPAQSPG